MSSVVIKLTLAVLHLSALIYFALKYLRFDVRTEVTNSTATEFPEIIKSAINSISEEIDSIDTSPPPPIYDRFVFFLLDAWRWNFLFDERTEMKYLQSKIMEGEAVGLVSIARIPTVTKPCLKSIFAGTHPVFFEIVENIDESGVTETVTSSTSTTQDNLLRRLRAGGKRMAVYGDDVWGKLFPMSTFYRHDLAFGFNIMDYTSVDNLVHKGFETEKNSQDGSDVIILHYLGLDHIGHSYAAKSEYVIPKLREMDAKIREVYDWAAGRDADDGRKTLILMMGDHGMTSDGNHGGGSKDEAQAAAVFMSPHFGQMKKFEEWREAIEAAEKDSCNQEDIAATLTALLDSSTPLKFGNGCLIEKVMKAAFISGDLESQEERLLLLKNLRHLLEKSGENVEDIEKLLNKTKFPLSKDEIYELSEAIKKILNSKSFTFDEDKLRRIVLVLCIVASIYSLFWLREVSFNLNTAVTIVSVLILAACQSATSFIGEEHLLWQGAFVAAVLAWSLKSTKLLKGVARVLVVHRILCGWNGIGTIWVNERTLGSWIKSHDLIEGVSVALALIWLIRRGKCGFKSRVAQCFASILVFLHRIGFKWIPSYHLAQAALIILASDVAVSKMRNLETGVAILFVLVNKPVNAIPVALLLYLAHEIVELEDILGPASAFLQVCTMQCAYYALGLWNSVSAIDLTFGAVFTKSFDMKIAPAVLLMYSLSGPILVSLYLSKRSRLLYSELTFIRSVLDSSACAFAFQHRFHAWIFDFFSPKILFQVFWAVFYSLLLPLMQKIFK